MIRKGVEFRRQVSQGEGGGAERSESQARVVLAEQAHGGVPVRRPVSWGGRGQTTGAG